MIIILDFNRTIYDPDTKDLVPGALALLQYLKGKQAEVHLISRKEEGREDLLQTFGIASYFNSVTFTEDKEPAMEKLIKAHPVPVYVVGDHLHNEVRLGNRYGARTIWLRRGRFKDLEPETHEDVPWQTIAELTEAPDFLTD